MFRLVLRLWPKFFLWLLVFLNIEQVSAQITPPKLPNIPIYTPLPLTLSNDIQGTLTDRDIPLGDGGFARDYAIQLIAGDQVAIDLVSDNFDPIVALLSKEGKTIGKNDDGPDGTSNSLLFARIKKTGTYTIRVQGFSETSGGDFTLRVNRLKVTP
jgi:hypothetical protein